MLESSSHQSSTQRTTSFSQLLPCFGDSIASPNAKFPMRTLTIWVSLRSSDANLHKVRRISSTHQVFDQMRELKNLVQQRGPEKRSQHNYSFYGAKVGAFSNSLKYTLMNLYAGCWYDYDDLKNAHLLPNLVWRGCMDHFGFLSM